MRPLARILEALQKIGYAHVIQHHLTHSSGIVLQPKKMRTLESSTAGRESLEVTLFWPHRHSRLKCQHSIRIGRQTRVFCLTFIYVRVCVWGL